ncbi:MAG: hypothetical protein IJ386_08760 [Clostridia bacterium]|nr:hypothetical protein [Clostridia bacterium]
MAEYIDLNNTEVLAEAGENAKLVVEEAGELKRIPASAVGQVKTVNGVEPDETGNVEIDIPEGFSGSWNDLTEKPFYEIGTSVKWDGNTEGLVNSTKYYKVSDAVPTKEQCIGGHVTLVTNGSSTSGQFTEDALQIDEENIFGCDYFCVVKEDGTQYAGKTFPEKGIYFLKMGDAMYMSELTTADYDVKPLDARFLPEGVSVVPYAGSEYFFETTDNGQTVKLFKTEIEFNGLFDIEEAIRYGMPVILRDSNSAEIMRLVSYYFERDVGRVFTFYSAVLLGYVTVKELTPSGSLVISGYVN